MLPEAREDPEPRARAIPWARVGPGLYLGPESGPSSGVHCVVGLTDAHPPLTSEGVTVTIAKLQ